MNPLALLGPERGWFLAGLAGSLLAAASVPLVPLLVVRPLYDRVLAGGDWARLPALVATAAALVVAGAAALLLQDAMFGRGAAAFGGRARAAVYSAMLRTSPVRTGGAGRAGRAALDVRELETFFAFELTVLAAQGLVAAAGLGLLVWHSPRLTLAIAAVLLALALILSRLGRRVERAFKSAQDAAEGATARMAEGLDRVEVVKAYRLENRALADFERANRAQTRASARRALLSSLQAPIAQAATGLGLAALLLLAAGEVRAGRLTAGALTAYLAQLGIALAPLQMLARSWGRWSAARAPARSVHAAMLLPPEPDPGVLRAPSAGWLGEVELESVVARYPGAAEPALRGVGLRLRAGEAVALVGASGGGKSTVVRLLLRLLEPEAGRVLLDGRDLREYRLADARAAVALVPQEPGLFAGTIAENLRAARPDAPEDALWASLELAGVSDEVRAMPRGLKTVLGDGGAGVSGGQAQRLAIARALLADAPVIVLDEPTSALDAHSETMVRRAIEGLRGRRTVLVIAHRLSTVESVDRVVVLEHGRAVEEGPPGRLASAGGHFARLLEAARA